jgi:methanethiol S-methyltransferase
MVLQTNRVYGILRWFKNMWSSSCGTGCGQVQGAVSRRRPWWAKRSHGEKADKRRSNLEHGGERVRRACSEGDCNEVRLPAGTAFAGGIAMGRWAMLAYGVTACLTFFGVSVYLIVFIGNISEPFPMRTLPHSSPLEAALVDVGLVGLFALQHLIMARQGFKKWWTRFIPEPAERSTFVLAANVCLLVLFVFWQKIPLGVWELKGQILTSILHASLSLGLILTAYSIFLIAPFDLLGLHQVYSQFRKEPYTPVPFTVTSLYKWVRHPAMLGVLMMLWSAPVMTGGRFILSTGFSIFIFIGIWFEERDLMRDFGQAYIEYRSRTPMLFPFPGRRNAPSP